MSEVVRFPQERVSNRLVAKYREEMAEVVILPVVRVERLENAKIIPEIISQGRFYGETLLYEAPEFWPQGEG